MLDQPGPESVSFHTSNSLIALPAKDCRRWDRVLIEGHRATIRETLATGTGLVQLHTDIGCWIMSPTWQLQRVTL